jgi:hypothetical protein
VVWRCICWQDEELYDDDRGIACDVNEGSEDMQISKAMRQGRKIRT